MNLGGLLITVAFLAAVAAALLFAGSLLGRKPARAAAAMFVLHTALAVTALTLLGIYFVQHRFEFDYVTRYSSRALSPALTLASLWAGQEGSILLWAALGALVGVALLRQPGALTHPAMFFVSLAQAWIFSLLLVRSPFVQLPVTPADGMGLNPLLEDPWMVVHPPVLFLGYAALVAPYALAAAALIRNEARDWNRMVWPWTLFGVVTLGAGIGLGGVWAYKTLGWGGYWGWDPVENASLVPWLVSVGLIHGLLIQRTTGSLLRTNFALAFLAWITVLGGTYLTRSGVLQDFSVHSFAESGLNGPLVGCLGLTTLLGAGLLLWRWRTIERGHDSWLDLSRQSALWLGLMTVVVLAALVALGTTAPLITALSGRPASVSVKYYEYVSVPVGIVLVLLMALAPALRWSRQQGLAWMTALGPGAVVAALLTAGGLLAGLRRADALGFAALAGFALGVNAAVSLRLFKRGWSYGAGYFVHVGVAVMVFGMVISSALGKSERLRLLPDQPTQALGYTLTYQGTTTGSRGEQVLAVRAERGPWRFDARPVLVPAPRDQGMVRRPAIDAWKDFYLAPLEVAERAPSAEPVWLVKNQQTTAGGMNVTFTGFRMVSHEKLQVHADLRFEKDGKILEASPGIRAESGGSVPLPAEVPGLGSITVAHIDADRGRVAVQFPAAAAPVRAALVEVTTKPFINLVWIGALLALIGSAAAGIRRAMDRHAGRPARPAASPKPAGAA